LTGHWYLFVDVLLAAIAAAGVYLVRGVLGGMRRFTGYAATLGGEGIGRLVLTGVLALTGTLVVGYYGLFYGLATVVGAVAGLRWLRGRPTTAEVPVPAGGVPDSAMGRGLLLLLTATVLMQVAANVAPIVVTSRLTADAVTASAFASAFVLVRIPLFVLSPVQAMLLPSLTAAAAHGDFDKVRSGIRKIMIAVAVVGGLGVLASATVGPWAVQVLFGARTHLSGVLLGLLGVSTVLLMVAQVLQPALVALGMHRGISLSWLVGTAVLGGMLVLPGDPLRAAVIGQLIGPALVVIGMTLSLRGVLRSSQVDPPAELANAQTDQPGLT
jgi:O-antigen/teichoic acid export membrane protein